jgi:hypothetical protein
LAARGKHHVSSATITCGIRRVAGDHSAQPVVNSPNNNWAIHLQIQRCIEFTLEKRCAAPLRRRFSEVLLPAAPLNPERATHPRGGPTMRESDVEATVHHPVSFRRSISSAVTVAMTTLLLVSAGAVVGTQSAVAAEKYSLSITGKSSVTRKDGTLIEKYDIQWNADNAQPGDHYDPELPKELGSVLNQPPPNCLDNGI